MNEQLYETDIRKRGLRRGKSLPCDYCTVRTV